MIKMHVVIESIFCRQVPARISLSVQQRERGSSRDDWPGSKAAACGDSWVLRRGWHCHEDLRGWVTWAWGLVDSSTLSGDI